MSNQDFRGDFSELNFQQYGEHDEWSGRRDPSMRDAASDAFSQASNWRRTQAQGKTGGGVRDRVDDHRSREGSARPPARQRSGHGRPIRPCGNTARQADDLQPAIAGSGPRLSARWRDRVEGALPRIGRIRPSTKSSVPHLELHAPPCPHLQFGAAARLLHVPRDEKRAVNGALAADPAGPARAGTRQLRASRSLAMAYEQLRNSALPRAVSDVVGDVADLLQKRFASRARDDLIEAFDKAPRRSVDDGYGGSPGWSALLLVIEAAVFAITAFGVDAVVASCVIVAAVLGVAAGVFYVLGRADADEDLTPTCHDSPGQTGHRYSQGAAHMNGQGQGRVRPAPAIGCSAAFKPEIPEGLLLLATGCALLLRARALPGGGAWSGRPRICKLHEQRRVAAHHRRRRTTSGNFATRMVSRYGAADEERRGGAYADTAADYAGQLRQTVGQQSGRAVDQGDPSTARNALDRVLQRRPLVLAATPAWLPVRRSRRLFPATRIEEQTLEAGRRADGRHGAPGPSR